MGANTGIPVIYDMALTSTPTPLSATSLLFSGWLTCPVSNGGNVTLTVLGQTLSAPYQSAVRSATQGDYFPLIDLSKVLASGNGLILCISGTTSNNT